MDILIADADEETRLTLAEAIAAVDPVTRIDEARDGRELRCALAGPPPDLVFIDTVLPGTDGEAVLTWRAGPGAGSVLTLVTDLLAPSWLNAARRLDAYDVLLKPLTVRIVEHVLQATALLRRELAVLLVEPQDRTRDLAKRALDQSIFRLAVTEAADGASAVRAARLQSFDLVLLNAALPDVPATEVACRIDALRTGARTVLTGRASTEPPPETLALFGVGAFLRVPFAPADVDRAVYRAFDLWRPYGLQASPAEGIEHRATGRVPLSAMPT